MLLDIVAGLVHRGPGAPGPMRGDGTAALVITQAHGNYAEPSIQGALMTACNAVAGVAPGTALSTTPPMCVWNPPSSGVNLSILKTAIGYISGTLGAGTIVYATVTNQTTIPTTGTEIVPQNEKIGFPRGMGRSFSGSTLVGTPAVLRPAYSFGAFLATTALAPIDLIDVVDGSIVIPPGCVFVVQAIAAAGTSPLMLLAVTWEEIPA
jgi:hypothetical protein